MFASYVVPGYYINIIQTLWHFKSVNNIFLISKTKNLPG